MPTESLYPPAPDKVPPEITRLDGGYRVRVLAMIGGLFVFLLVYLVFIAAAGLLAWWLIMFPMPHKMQGRELVFILICKIGGTLAPVLLMLFLVKGLFKGQTVQQLTHVPLKEAEHPELFAFIRRVYQDVGAPPPRRVYVSPEVNAALVYNSSLLSLFIPPRKDLLIGLGLVNVINLAEFKAVLAHEFGHFAQRSVGLGSYLYVANRVMSDVIYSRDGLDQFLDSWCSVDLRLSFPAWGLKGALWGVRQVLAGTFKALNLLHLSLSRQMEFNADNVAVSVSGSDALIHGLARLEFANQCLADAADSLSAAADHGHFSDDLFHHQSEAAGRLRKLRKDPKLGLPPDLPDDATEKVQVFAPLNDGIPERYRSHPTDHMRERNAKRFYVRSPRDERSPWLLFGDAAELKRTVTGVFYQHVLNRKEEYRPTSAALVQCFVDAEHAEKTYNPVYHGLYDDRFINPGDLDALPSLWPRAETAHWLTTWPPGDLEGQVAAHRERQGEFNVLQGLQTGQFTLTGKTFTFRGQAYTAGDVQRILRMVDDEINADMQAFHRLDRQAFLAYWSLARHLDQEDGGGRERELLERYRFHLGAQKLLQSMFGEDARLKSILQFLGANQQLPREDFSEVVRTLREIHESVRRILDEARHMATPALTNVPAGSALYALIVDRGTAPLAELKAGSANITGEWLGALLARLDGVMSRLKRLHFKSLGSLLAFQENMSKSICANEQPAGQKPAVRACD